MGWEWMFKTKGPPEVPFPVSCLHDLGLLRTVYSKDTVGIRNLLPVLLVS